MVVSTDSTHMYPPVPTGAVEKSYLNEKTGIWSWIVTLDHKRIGVMYLISILTPFWEGDGVTDPDGASPPRETIVDPDTYNGNSPAEPSWSSCSSFEHTGCDWELCPPAHAGSQRRAFPRLNLASYYLYVWAPSSACSQS